LYHFPYILGQPNGKEQGRDIKKTGDGTQNLDSEVLMGPEGTILTLWHTQSIY